MLIIEVNRSQAGEQQMLFSDECKHIVGIRQETCNGRPVLYIHTALTWDEMEKPADITAAIDAALRAMDLAASKLREDTSKAPNYQAAKLAMLEVAELVIARDKLAAAAAPEKQMSAGKWYAVTERDERQRRQEFIDQLKRNLEKAHDRIDVLLRAGERLDKAIGGNQDEILAAVDHWRTVANPPKKQPKKHLSKPRTP